MVCVPALPLQCTHRQCQRELASQSWDAPIRRCPCKLDGKGVSCAVLDTLRLMGGLSCLVMGQNKVHEVLLFELVAESAATNV
eukprot:3480682-Amphidinium_carterae.1